MTYLVHPPTTPQAPAARDTADPTYSAEDLAPLLVPVQLQNVVIFALETFAGGVFAAAVDGADAGGGVQEGLQEGEG